MKPTDPHAHDELPPSHNGSARPGPPHGGAEERRNPEVAHEASDINVRAVVMFAVGMIVVAGIVQVAMYLLFGYFERSAVRNDPKVSPVAAPELVMPKTTAGSPFFGGAAGPQLVTSEPRLLQMLHQRENQDLHTYGWVDKQAGVARIPIDQAEKLLLQRGLPSRTAGQVDPRLGTKAQSIGESSSGREIPLIKQQATGSAQPSGPEAGSTPQAGQEPGTQKGPGRQR